MMSSQRSLDARRNKLPEGELSMESLWIEADIRFKEICGKSLQKGDVKSFDDLKKKIEEDDKKYGTDQGEEKKKWDKAKSVGLKSLEYLKMLVGVASQASGFIPIPDAATRMTSSALCFVLDIPAAIRGYNDAIDQVFSAVAPALSQFKIYQSMKHIDQSLLRQINHVMVKFVEVCAHVVTYKQDDKLKRFLKKSKVIFEGDPDLSLAMKEFKEALTNHHHLEATITLAEVVDMHAEVVDMHEDQTRRFEDLGKKADETRMGVQSLNKETEYTNMLSKIRDSLGVWTSVQLDGNTTQTCQDYVNKCIDGTGKWIDQHEAYTTWTAPNDESISNVLVVSGPRSSGKTSATALITKRLQQRQDRTYVAHYFFPAESLTANTKRSEGEIITVQQALKYMAFQLAKVDLTARKALSKACSTGFRSSSSTDLYSLWGELKIGESASGITYYLVFDGVENLPRQEAEMLLKFLSHPKLATGSMGRLRVMVSGTDGTFNRGPATIGDVLRIEMKQQNCEDMRVIVEAKLNHWPMLQQHRNREFNSIRQKARDKIIAKLPKNAEGSYSMLHLGLEDIFRLLSTRMGGNILEELDQMLDRPISSQESAIRTLQQSLTADEVSEVNELLKWVLFSREIMTLKELEAAMILYSDTASFTSLQEVIESNYSAVLKIDGNSVYIEDRVKELLQRGKDTPAKSSQDKRQATISMTITINNVDQEVCGNFFWDLAQKAIRDKFKFDFNATSNALGSNQAIIGVEEFDAHRTIVKLAFKYLKQKPEGQTKDIGEYLIGWLPYHLGRLGTFEDEEKESLAPDEKLEVGRNLYDLFKDNRLFERHRESFDRVLWWPEEIEIVQGWLHDPAVVRRVDKQWKDEMKLAINPTRGFLKGWVSMVLEGFLRKRSGHVGNAYRWIVQFMQTDIQRAPYANDVDDDASSSTSSASNTIEIDWGEISNWCQRYLELPDSSLDSLWYERLAEAASVRNSNPDVIISLYKRAMETEDYSWLCHRGLGKTYRLQGRTSEAIGEMELALKRAERDDATPEPEEKDIAGLHLLLGDYIYSEQGADVQKAVEHYIFACSSGDSDQAKRGHLGRLKATLRFSSEDEARNLLKDTLARESGEGDMLSLLKMIALDEQHGAIFTKMFNVVKGHRDIFRGIVRTMETTTTKPATVGDRTEELDEDKRFEEDETRGVLLYYRGVAAYTYKESPEGTEPVREALRLWQECRRQLSDVGGSNSSVVRTAAITDLAKHYFRSMVGSRELDHINELEKLASDSNSNDDPVGFLGALYALRGDKQQSKKVLLPQVTHALEILSDETPDNDYDGYSLLYTTLMHYGDFVNAVVGLSMMGQPDLVTEALDFRSEDIVGDVEDKESVLVQVTKLAQETIKVAKDKVRDSSQQIQRIEAAKEHVESLLAATETKYEAEVADEIKAKRPEDHGEGVPTSPDFTTAAAHRFLLSRLSTLQEKHSPGLNTDDIESWMCDGRTPDGERCKKEGEFESNLYHCIYCFSRDFCEDCLRRLRDPTSCVEITACSAEHRWLRLPPLGGDMYGGLWPESVLVPIDVRPVEDDERILEAHYASDGGCQKRKVEEWKQALAAEWGIILGG
ncbi:hypothetical protein SLS53_005645 [Cytospora paraplurivora]|uniref:Fungal STAND N-terminal Goodbye domain-containing protein n=1 Tax=Cytospora paraplurivora TaxID=2898453 RepID=A0AAN9YFZ7_9PEZI